MVDTAPNIWTEGCSHFRKFCKIWTPCCNDIYACSLCHDENEDHALNKNEITQIICTSCGALQPLKTRCRECGISFGKYVCLICKVFDNENKGQFHCQQCGICRSGGEENYFHCLKCNMCLALRLLDQHMCVENISRGNCPLCLEYLHTSSLPLYVPSCGHLLHKSCYEELCKKGHKTCPICKAKYFW